LQNMQEQAAAKEQGGSQARDGHEDHQTYQSAIAHHRPKKFPLRIPSGPVTKSLGVYPDAPEE